MTGHLRVRPSSCHPQVARSCPNASCNRHPISQIKSVIRVVPKKPPYTYIYTSPRAAAELAMLRRKKKTFFALCLPCPADDGHSRRNSFRGCNVFFGGCNLFSRKSFENVFGVLFKFRKLLPKSLSTTTVLTTMRKWE